MYIQMEPAVETLESGSSKNPMAPLSQQVDQSCLKCDNKSGAVKTVTSMMTYHEVQCIFRVI